MSTPLGTVKVWVPGVLYVVVDVGNLSTPEKKEGKRLRLVAARKDFSRTLRPLRSPEPRPLLFDALNIPMLRRYEG